MCVQEKKKKMGRCGQDGLEKKTIRTFWKKQYPSCGINEENIYLEEKFKHTIHITKSVNYGY